MAITSVNKGTRNSKRFGVDFYKVSLVLDFQNTIIYLNINCFVNYFLIKTTI